MVFTRVHHLRAMWGGRGGAEVGGVVRIVTCVQHPAGVLQPRSNRHCGGDVACVVHIAAYAPPVSRGRPGGLGDGYCLGGIRRVPHNAVGQFHGRPPPAAYIRASVCGVLVPGGQQRKVTARRFGG